VTCQGKCVLQFHVPSPALSLRNGFSETGSQRYSPGERRAGHHGALSGNRGPYRSTIERAECSCGAQLDAGIFTFSTNAAVTDPSSPLSAVLRCFSVGGVRQMAFCSEIVTNRLFCPIASAYRCAKPAAVPVRLNAAETQPSTASGGTSAGGIREPTPGKSCFPHSQPPIGAPR